MMNFKLSNEIYGNNVWMVDPGSFGAMVDILSDIRNKVPYENKGYKLNSFHTLDVSSIATVSSSRDLKSRSAQEELINIIDLDGPITVNGGVSTNGTKQLSKQMIEMDSDSRIIGHIIKANSGGGSGKAIQFMTDVMNSDLKKPVVSFIEKSSMACSACYGIISQSDYIISEKENNIVGSLGTMIEFGGFSKNNKDSNGRINVRIYSPDSSHKNEEYEEALEGNFKPIIENVLTPANDEFLALNVSGRPGLKKEHLTGKTFKAGDVLGSFIDEIGDFNVAINKVISLSNSKKGSKSKPSANNKSSKMNKEELKQSHPDVYASIVSEGVNAERDRVGAWMAHVETDSAAVKKGVQSGNEITASEREEFFVSQNKKENLASMIDNSAPPVSVGESKSTLKDVKPLEDKSEDFDFELKVPTDV